MKKSVGSGPQTISAKTGDVFFICPNDTDDLEFVSVLLGNNLTACINKRLYT